MTTPWGIYLRRAWGINIEPSEPDLVTVRRDDLENLLYAYDHPSATALGSRPLKRLRAAADDGA